MKLSYEERDGTTVPRLTTEESQAALGPFAAMRDEHLKARKPPSGRACWPTGR